MKRVDVWDRLAAHIPAQRNAQRLGDAYVPPAEAHLLTKDERALIDELIRYLVR